MITTNNYFFEVERIGLENLPDTLKRGHELVVKSTANGASWATYQNSENIRKVIDLYFQKLNDFALSSAKTEPQKKQSASSSKPQKAKQQKSVFHKAFNLLSKFIPNFSQHLKGGAKSGSLAINEDGSIREVTFSGDRDKGEFQDILLIDQIGNEQELLSDVRIYRNKKEAHVTADVLSFYYQEKYDREESQEDIEERDEDIGEVMTSTLVEWLEDLLQGNYHINLSKSNSKKEKTKEHKSKPNKSHDKVSRSNAPRKSIDVSFKKVEHIREEVKFIKRYVGLHNKVKSPNAILTFIKALQRSIIQKLIRKTSPLAKEIDMIQNKLIQVHNKMIGEESFAINEKDLNHLVAVAGGEQVYPSITVIKRFIGMQGKDDEKKTNGFLKYLETLVEKKKLTKEDPYADKVNAIYKSLRQRTSSKISISKAELSGLEGIVKACGCKKDLGKIYYTEGKRLRPCQKKTYSDASRGACSHNQGLSGVLTAEEMANRKLDLLNFISFWHSLFGNPARNFTMMFHGEPHNGKTIFLLMLAQYLAENFGDVLYVSSEEFASPTMTKKVNEFLNPLPQRLHFAENLNDPNLSDYEFIILDSVNDLGLKISEYKEMRKAHPDTAFIFILQHTKAGDFKGGKDWEHIAEIAGEVHKGVVTMTKNRYAPKSSLDFFRQFGIQWQEPNTSHTLKPYPINGDMMTMGNEQY